MKTRIEDVKISSLERFLANWALIPDVLYYHFIRKNEKYENQSLGERFRRIRDGKTRKYAKVVRLMKNHPDRINEEDFHGRYGTYCGKTLCSKSRYWMARARIKI